MIESSLSLRDFEYLVAVADHGHFGRAALAVHVTQPALSAQIKKIESYLGVVIFERNQKRFFITPKGKQIIEQARVLLSEAKRLWQLAQDKQALLEGALRIGAIASLGPYFFPHVLQPIRKKYPKLELWIQEGLTDGLIDQLRHGQLDAVLASPTFDDSDLHAIPLFFENFVLAAPKGHPLLKQKELHPRDLKASEMVLLADGHCLKDQTLEFCSLGKRGKIRPTHAASLETLRHLVAAGMGYTLMPELAVQDAALKSLIGYRKFHDKYRVGRDVVFYVRKNSAALTELTILARAMRERLPAFLTIF